MNKAGTVWCWGANAEGQVGDGTREDRNTPAKVTALAEPAVAIAAGTSHTCAALASGILKCWGGNTDGQVGDGSTTGKASPTTVQLFGPALRATKVYSRGSHTCALSHADGLYCWGRNADGQLGDNSHTSRASPVPINLAQKIILGTPTKLAPGATAQLDAVASSGLAVTLQSLTPTRCTLSGNTLSILPTAPTGTQCTIEAVQPGANPHPEGGSYRPAPKRRVSIKIEP